MFQFEWDENKASINLKKHKVSFLEASTAFFDENARLLADPEHSDEEDRFILLGFSQEHKMLIVCHCYKGNEQTVRIISARKATKHETNQYWSFYEKRV